MQESIFEQKKQIYFPERAEKRDVPRGQWI
jgi:hypothetical protein